MRFPAGAGLQRRTWPRPPGPCWPRLRKPPPPKSRRALSSQRIRAPSKPSKRLGGGPERATWPWPAEPSTRSLRWSRPSSGGRQIAPRLIETRRIVTHQFGTPDKKDEPDRSGGFRMRLSNSSKRLLPWIILAAGWAIQYCILWNRYFRVSFVSSHYFPILFYWIPALALTFGTRWVGASRETGGCPWARGPEPRWQNFFSRKSKGSATPASAYAPRRRRRWQWGVIRRRMAFPMRMGSAHLLGCIGAMMIWGLKKYTLIPSAQAASPASWQEAFFISSLCLGAWIGNAIEDRFSRVWRAGIARTPSRAAIRHSFTH